MEVKMKIYNLVLALVLVVIMATAVSAAVSISPISTQKIATYKESTTVSYTATVGMSYSADCADPAIAIAGTPSSSSVVISRGTMIGSTSCTVTVWDPGNPSDTASASFTINVEPESKLSIDRLNLLLNGDSDRLSDGDDFEAQIGDTLEFEIKIENLYDGDDEEDIEIENVEVTIEIESWDDGDDEEFDSDDDVDIKPDDTETLVVNIGEIPSDIDDGSHQITITVEGEDEEGFEHRVVWTLEMEIEKEDEDIKVYSASIEPTTVSCSRSVTLNVKLLNAGTDDSDEIVLLVENSALGISRAYENIELDEGDSESFEYVFNIPEDAAPGLYTIKLFTFFDDYRYDNDDTTDVENVQLTVVKCEQTTPTTPEEEEEEEEEEVVVVEPTEPIVPEEEEQEPEKETISWGISDKTLVIALIVLNVLLLIAIIAVIITVTSN